MFNGFIDVLKRCYVSYNVNNNNSNDMQCLMCFKFILKPHNVLVSLILRQSCDTNGSQNSPVTWFMYYRL